MALFPVGRFRSFLLYLGYSYSSARDMKITRFCRIISEFALEYRTARERVLQQKQKRAAYRERNKTRGRMITEVSSLLPASTDTYVHTQVITHLFYVLFCFWGIQHNELTMMCLIHRPPSSPVLLQQQRR